jgi:hypothetical protein
VGALMHQRFVRSFTRLFDDLWIGVLLEIGMVDACACAWHDDQVGIEMVWLW